MIAYPASLGQVGSVITDSEIPRAATEMRASAPVFKPEVKARAGVPSGARSRLTKLLESEQLHRVAFGVVERACENQAAR
jgi:hypothetical protein